MGDSLKWFDKINCMVVCDFGFAKVVNGDITKKGAHSICGTEEYMVNFPHQFPFFLFI